MNTKKIVGVDTHKNTLACYCDGKFKEFNAKKDFHKIVCWAGKNAVFAVEGSYCYGQPFSAYLIKNGIDVFEINPLLTKTWRGALSISNPKNDYGDAKVISLFAHTSKLEKVSLETVKLKEKLTTRKNLVKQKTQITNSLKMITNTRGDELPFKDLTTKKAIKWLKENNDIIIRTTLVEDRGKELVRIQTTLDNEVKQLINKRILFLEKQIKETISKIENIVKENEFLSKNFNLLITINGISFNAAWRILAELNYETIDDITPKSLVAHAGLSPREYSSGSSVHGRMCISKMGKTDLRKVMYMPALS